MNHFKTGIRIGGAVIGAILSTLATVVGIAVPFAIAAVVIKSAIALFS